MQYLVSVIHDGTELATPGEMAAIDVFNERLQTEGHWVFAAGVGVHRRALRGVKGVPRRLLDHRGSRPRRGAEAGSRGVEGLQPEGRGAAVPVESSDVRETSVPTISALHRRRFGHANDAAARHVRTSPSPATR